MDFAKQKPHDIGNTLPVNMQFEVDDVEASYEFELMDYKKEQCFGKLSYVRTEGCYLVMRLGEEFAACGAGTYQIRISKDCVECTCIPIKMTNECHVVLHSTTGPKTEGCDFCE